ARRGANKSRARRQVDRPPCPSPLRCCAIRTVREPPRWRYLAGTGSSRTAPTLSCPAVACRVSVGPNTRHMITDDSLRLVAPELLERVLDKGAVDRAVDVDALRREPVGHVPVDVVLQERRVELAVGIDRQAHRGVQGAVAHPEVVG